MENFDFCRIGFERQNATGKNAQGGAEDALSHGKHMIHV